MGIATTHSTGRIFLHGLESSSQGTKAQMFRSLFPDMYTPDLSGTLSQRMVQAEPIFALHTHWLIVGSSFGGLMGALWACAQPERVLRLVLLAPALNLPDFADTPPEPVTVPVEIFHGERDTVVPMTPVWEIAEQVFLNLEFHVVDDEHRLTETAPTLDWQRLLAVER
jgi:pimeloyl-ACP methyl ester carboxylesterase